ncbi:MAG: GAF domain-containing protein [candidate division WOR-3 bacterium]|nr:GAF domain-containing protein [candidate division WOR-3 bacterium]
MKANGEINDKHTTQREAERYLSVVKTLPDIVYRIDPEGIFLFINDSVRSLGYQPEELVGEHFSKIVHPDDVKLFARNFVLPAYSGKKTGDEDAPKLFDERRTGDRKTTDLEIRLLLKKKADGMDERIGTVIAFGDVSSTGHYDKEVEDTGKKFLGTLGIIRDITERKKSEELLKKLNRALKVVTECDQVLVRATDETKLLSDICEIIVNLGGYKFAWVGVAPDGNTGVVRPVAHAGYEHAYLDVSEIHIPGQEDEPVSQAILTRKPQIIKRLDAHPARAPWRSEATERGYNAMIALPLNEDGNIFGTLNIYSVESDVFDAEEVKLLTELSDDLAYGIASLHTRVQGRKAAEEVQNSYKKLRMIFEQTVNALASAVGKRDPYTTDHQRRVTALASAIAQEMGLHEEQVNGIRLAGMLHDIGKLAVPSEILSKPTRLSEAEFTIIKTHPRVASDILKAIEFPWPISDIVLQHHERIDGSGYPQGLLEKNILLETRILSVADVVEAISSHRPYRPAYSLEYTLEEISRNKGITYDVNAVDACLKLFAEKDFRFE